MRYGFKAQAERLAVNARAALGLKASSPLDPWIYAEHLGVLVLDFNKVDISQTSRKRLLHVDSEGWSGMTIREGGTTAIIINPSHAQVRQVNTLMHELSHIILKHVPVRVEVSETGVLLLSDYSEDDEAAADWLAAAMLLPREILIQKRQLEKTVVQIATEFGISVQLCEWRLRMTGVDVQLRRSSKR